MEVAVRSIGHVGLAVRDLDVAVRFYTEQLGLSLTESFTYPDDEVGHGIRVVAGAFLRIDETHHRMSLFVLKGDVPGRDVVGSLGLHHLAFELGSPDELLALYRRFKANGVRIVSARRGGPGNQPRFYAEDPDGNLLEFYWGIDKIGWDGVPREYPDIEEIDIERFDFDAFVAKRAEDAGTARSVRR